MSNTRIMLSNHLSRITYTLVAIVGALFALSLFAMSAAPAYAQTPEYDFKLVKKISDNLPVNPYAPEDFSFEIVGVGTFALADAGGGLAEVIVSLEAGTYT